MPDREIGTGDPPSQPPSTGELPEWALTFADAAIRCDMKAPDIEEGLAKKGLSPTLAKAVVDRCFERRCQAVRRRDNRVQILTSVSRAASLVIVTTFLIALGFKCETRQVFQAALVVIFPLVCIWFSDAFGRFVGWGPGMRYINRPTPSIFIAIGGWVLLLSLLTSAIIVGVK